jgi:hypothetical protein
LKASLASAEEKAGGSVASIPRSDPGSANPLAAGGMPDLSALGGGLGGLDLGSIMSNPGFMQMASQFMSNPAFSSMLQNPQMAEMYVLFVIFVAVP